ncbi:UDP- c:beta-1,3-N-acetylgalactosaminyltransferase 2-like, partial [Paramuricea clavata]
MRNYDVVLSILCLLFHVVVLNDNYLGINNAINTENFIQDQHYDLVVGILSAQSNFYLRESLRKTWVGHAQQHSPLKERILIKFIISNESCSIPPEFRVDPYRCEESVLKDIDLGKELIAYQMPEGITLGYLNEGPVGRDFNVLYPLVITSLGISTNGLSENINTNTTVRLFDRISKKEIVSVNFTVESTGTQVNGSRFKTVPNYILPKDFQASIVIENSKCTSPGCRKCEEFTDIQDNGGLFKTLKVRRFSSDGGSFPEIEETTPDERCVHGTGTFMYLAYDAAPGKSLTKEERQDRVLEWQQLKQEENVRLQEESKKFSDVLFVPNVDVYRNLPSQLLGFYRWIAENVPFSFALKTDDDCFVDLENILQEMEEYKLKNKSKLWWSSFRSDWLIERQGKWAEPDYPGVTYPTFACGAGNVLSADLVHWLAGNADSLKRYQ